MDTCHKTLAIIVPCFNEEQVIDEAQKVLSEKICELKDKGLISQNSFICFVDDGSKDGSWEKIKELSLKTQNTKGLRLSTNFGHQNALMAGMLESKDTCDIAISIDADLQQDPNSIDSFIEKHYEGYDIVFGKRKNRNTDSFFKKISAQNFYKLLNIAGIKIIPNHADYRLVSSHVIEALSEYKETNLFLRGLFANLGFKTAIVEHEVVKRKKGKSKYSLKKMIAFALNGIVSYTDVPLKLISFTGFIVFLFSAIMGFYVLFMYFLGTTVKGWASNLLAIYFLGGIQLLSLGIIGEYISKIYMEVKARPRYIIRESV